MSYSNFSFTKKTPSPKNIERISKLSEKFNVKTFPLLINLQGHIRSRAKLKICFFKNQNR